MGDVHRLGRRGVALGAAIAVTFGLGAGVLASRWSEAQAAPAPESSGPVPIAEGDSPPVPVPGALQPAPEPAPAPQAETCGASGRIVRWRVAVERGLPIDEGAFAQAVEATLCDPRGWTASDVVRFRYDPAGPVRVRLESPEATERRCLRLIGLSVREKWSCASRSHGEIVLNADRWFEGSPSWPGSTGHYRQMLVNHEMGHILGHGHRSCTRAGGAAPVMMQQSKGLLGCEPNPWPVRGELRATRL